LRLGEVTAVDSFENTFSIAFVSGEVILGRGDFFALLLGALGGEAGLFEFLRFGVLGIILIIMKIYFILLLYRRRLLRIFA